MYPVKVPFFWKWFYPRQLWHKPRDHKVIYLTFDDGPIPVVTPWVLKTLSEFEAKATFFCIGDNVRKYPEVFSQVLADGHRVGNHTFNHLKGSATPDDVYLENIDLCRQRVDSDLFRPPYGRIKGSQVKRLVSRESGVGNREFQTQNLELKTQNYKIVMWDVLSGDFDTKLPPEKCLQNVLRNTEAGSIVVFHDSEKAFPRLEYALPRALEKWKNEGFEFEVL